jgi:hypothetical protein
MPNARFLPGAEHGLSDEAQGLSPALLDVQAVLAETQLGLRALPLPGAGAGEEARALIAVAEQINYQVVLQSAGRGALGSEGRGSESVVIARDPRTGQVNPVSPIAAAIAKTLLEELVPVTPVEEVPVSPKLPGYSRVEVAW